jgi:hypothetical protein
MTEESMERAVVSRGRTVCVPDPTMPSVFAGREPDTHRELFAPGLRDYGPGEEVELPRDEVKRLRALGFFVDPDAKEVLIDDGRAHAEFGGRLTLK